MKIRIFTSRSMGENCYVITDEKSGESAVTDPGEYSAELDRYLKNEVKVLKYILFTHGHFDHIGGTGEIKRKFGGKICIHPYDEICLSDGKKNLSALFGIKCDINEKADIYAEDNTELYLGENKITVLHTPGHSPGSVSYMTGNEIFTGDTLFRLSYGRTDFDGGDFDALCESVFRLLKIDSDLTVYPGHNEKSSLSFERKYNPLMRG